MRQVILPKNALIYCTGKFDAGLLVSGDRIQGYDYRNRKPVMITIAYAKPMPPQNKVVILTDLVTLNFCATTVLLTPYGERLPKDKPRELVRYCGLSPKIPRMREVLNQIDYNINVDAVKLVWECPDYIISQGILVGTEFSSADN